MDKSGYVPSILYPTENGYGDYVILDIDGYGNIQGWKENYKYFLK